MCGRRRGSADTSAAVSTSNPRWSWVTHLGTPGILHQTQLNYLTMVHCMSSTRLLHLNAFLHDIGHHEAAWRLPESNPFDTVNVEHYIKLARIAEAGTFDSVFFADSPSLQNDPRYRPIGILDPTTTARRTRGHARAHRPDRDGLHQLRRALRPRAAVRVDRPHQWWPCRLEHRDHRQPRCSAELRPRRPRTARRPLRARRGVRRGRQEAVGQLGGRRGDRRQADGSVRRRLEDPHDRPRRQVLPRRPGRSTPRARRRAIHCWSRPASPSRVAASRRARPRRCSRRSARSRTARRFTPT